LWQQPARYYLFTKGNQVDHMASLVGKEHLITMEVSGGKVLLTNHPLAPSIDNRNF
jgi:hypothetical protein